MATTKTIQPTGATITIPAFTDQPDARVFSTDVDNITDAVNSTNQAFRTVTIDGIQYLRGAFSTSGQVLERIQAFLNAMDTKNSVTFFDVNLTGSGNFHFNGYVYASKTYGTGIFQVPGGATYLWQRDNNTDSINAVAPKMTKIEVGNRITTSTTLAYTGLSFTIPARSFFCLYGTGIFINSRPKEIVLSSSSEQVIDHNILAKAEEAGTATYGGYTPSEITVYLWARYASAAGNDVALRGFYCPA